MIALGLLMWTVPFITSFFFFDVNTQAFTIDEHVFKSIMLLESSLLGVLVIAYYFRDLRSGLFREGLVLGTVIFLVNCIMDINLLLPMSKMPLDVWFGQIGARYLMAPIMAGAMGYMGDRK